MGDPPTTRPFSLTSRDSLLMERRTRLFSLMAVTPLSKDTPTVTGSVPPLLTAVSKVWLATTKRSSDPSCASTVLLTSKTLSSSSTRTPGVTVLLASPRTDMLLASSRLRSKPVKSASTSQSQYPCSPSLETRLPCGELLTSTVRVPSTSTLSGRLSPLAGRILRMISTPHLPPCPLSRNEQEKTKKTPI